VSTVRGSVNNANDNIFTDDFFAELEAESAQAGITKGAGLLNKYLNKEKN